MALSPVISSAKFSEGIAPLDATTILSLAQLENLKVLREWENNESENASKKKMFMNNYSLLSTSSNDHDGASSSICIFPARCASF